MKYKAIIFDCDGVLVDSESITMNVFIDLFKDYSIDITYEEAIQTLTGKAFDQIVSYIQEKYQVTLKDNFEAEFRKRTFQAFENDIQPIPGIKEVVEHLSLPFAVASNGPMNKMELNLKTTGLYSFFKGNMFSAYDLNAWKPDPKVFLTAAAHLNVAPEDSLVIEDSLSGIQAAKNGGFNVLAYCPHEDAEKFSSQGIDVFTSMKDLLVLIK
ncbi:HAD family hydrolase [Flammeovirga agarivorans]|uniref:HAD family hydrolase n=1 Tax=Flammeovirga agarivorans TaxID=2726742 RepID=A0A7X8SJQ2_9BACT|nr:HAD family hydrolase [Flammeovirga agarivorans]NLR91509.1 HAD family hydrolase [Flammeovirga agarivorans]